MSTNFCFLFLSFFLCDLTVARNWYSHHEESLGRGEGRATPVVASATYGRFSIHPANLLRRFPPAPRQEFIYEEEEVSARKSRRPGKNR